MSIYEKSVRLLLKDFVTNKNIAKGQILSKAEAMSWFRDNYPKIKAGTITAHLLRMLTGNPVQLCSPHRKKDGCLGKSGDKSIVTLISP